MGVPIRGMGLIKAVPFKVQVSLEDWKILEGHPRGGSSP